MSRGQSTNPFLRPASETRLPEVSGSFVDSASSCKGPFISPGRAGVPTNGPKNNTILNEENNNEYFPDSCPVPDSCPFADSCPFPGSCPFPNSCPFPESCPFPQSCPFPLRKPPVPKRRSKNPYSSVTTCPANSTKCDELPNYPTKDMPGNNTNFTGMPTSLNTKSVISVTPRVPPISDDPLDGMKSLEDHLKRTESDMEFLVDLLRYRNKTRVKSPSTSSPDPGFLEAPRSPWPRQHIEPTNTSAGARRRSKSPKIAADTVVSDDICKMQLMLNEFRKCKESLYGKNQPRSRTPSLDEQCNQNSCGNKIRCQETEPILWTSLYPPGSWERMSFNEEHQLKFDTDKVKPPEEEDTEWHKISATMLEQNSSIEICKDKDVDDPLKSINCDIEPNVLLRQPITPRANKSVSFLQPTTSEQLEQMKPQYGESAVVYQALHLNPFLYGPNIRHLQSPLSAGPSALKLENNESKRNLEPIRIDVTSKVSPQNPLMREDYEKHLLEKNLKSLNPGNFTILDPVRRKSPDELQRSPVCLQFPPQENPFLPNFALPPKQDEMFSVHGPSNIRLLTAKERQLAADMDRDNGNVPEESKKLGDVLHKLPVLSATQKVEEFRTRSAINANQLTTEKASLEDSITSIMPLASSNNTIASSPKITKSLSTIRSNSQELHTKRSDVDPNTMSVNELVTLGKKIYRILSELSTGSSDYKSPCKIRNSRPVASATAIKLEVSSTNRPLVVSRSSQRIQQTPSNNTPPVLVDFNSIPNPTFITGPAPRSVVSKLRGNVLRKSSSQRPSQTSVQASLSSLRKPGSKVVTSSFPWAKRLANKAVGNDADSENAKNRAKSLPQVYGKGASGHRFRYPNQTESSPLPDNRSNALSQRSPSNSTVPEAFPVKDKFKNNRRAANKQHVIRSPGNSSLKLAINECNSTDPPPPLVKSQKRNFIAENIHKVKRMTKIPDSRTIPRPLPPIHNRYENVQSRISESRSQSRSRSEVLKNRSSSVPAPSSAGENYLPVRSASNPRPSTGMSVHVASSLSPSTSPRPAGSVPRIPGVPKKISYADSKPKVPAELLPGHKSRSKTKRIAHTAQRFMRVVSNSSSNDSRPRTALQQKDTPNKPKKPERKKKSFPQKEKNTLKPEVFNTPSGQLIIRELVKDHMCRIAEEQARNRGMGKDSKSNPTEMGLLMLQSSFAAREQLDKLIGEYESPSKRNSKTALSVKSDSSVSLPRQRRRKKPASAGTSTGEDDDREELPRCNLSDTACVPNQYEQTLLSIERWMHPERNGGEPFIGKESPPDSPNSYDEEEDNRPSKGTGCIRAPTVRFSLPVEHRKSKDKNNN